MCILSRYNIEGEKGGALYQHGLADKKGALYSRECLAINLIIVQKKNHICYCCSALCGIQIPALQFRLASSVLPESLRSSWCSFLGQNGSHEEMCVFFRAQERYGSIYIRSLFACCTKCTGARARTTDLAQYMVPGDVERRRHNQCAHIPIIPKTSR